MVTTSFHLMRGHGIEAQNAALDFIIRNKRDFANSPVPTQTPGEFLTL